jgi:ABC-type antimicrobial peptide transport system permease subunit
LLLIECRPDNDPSLGTPMPAEQTNKSHSSAVAQRTRELGIRAALGSSSGGLMRLVTRQGLQLVGIGLLFGLAGGVAVTRLMTFTLYGVSPLDAITWSASVILMLLAGLAATLVPALRATRVNPLVAIQAE